MFGKINFPGREAPSKSIDSTQVPKTKPISKPLNSVKKSSKPQPNKKQDNTSSLKGSKFRVLNQLLYTRPSQQSLQYFQQHSDDFNLYHQGFREQASKWSHNPLHSIIGYLKKHFNNKSKLVLDLGCGQAELQETMAKVCRVRSFDLIAHKPFVQVADIAHLPVQDSIADACVFCLSLMGVNYIEFVQEAKRVLKEGGQLLISEVESRSKDWKGFINMIQSLGFENKVNKTNGFFRLIYFVSDSSKIRKLKVDGQFVDLKEYSQKLLGSCLYKKR